MVRKTKATKELDKIEEFVNKPKKKKVIVTENNLVTEKEITKPVELPKEFKGFTVETVKHKINWIGIFRKVSKIGSDITFIKISKNDVKNEWKNFKNKCNKNWHKFKKVIYSLYIEGYFDYNDWVKYCIWWEININRRNNGKN